MYSTTDSEYNQISEMNRILEEIQNQGRTIVWVAKQVKCKEKTFRNYTSNRSQPSNTTLRDIAKVLGVTMESLIK